MMPLTKEQLLNCARIYYRYGQIENSWYALLGWAAHCGEQG